MPIKLEIPESYLPHAKELYTNIAKEAYGKLVAAQKDWNDLQPILQQLGIELPETKLAPVIVKPIININGYNKDWSWADKARYILRKAGKGLTASAISDILITEYEPSLSKERVRNSLPATLSADAKKGKFISYSKGGELLYEIGE